MPTGYVCCASKACRDSMFSSKKTPYWPHRSGRIDYNHSSFLSHLTEYHAMKVSCQSGSKPGPVSIQSKAPMSARIISTSMVATPVQVSTSCSNQIKTFVRIAPFNGGVVINNPVSIDSISKINSVNGKRSITPKSKSPVSISNLSKSGVKPKTPPTKISDVKCPTSLTETAGMTLYQYTILTIL